MVVGDADRRPALPEPTGAVPDGLGGLTRRPALCVPFGLKRGGELGCRGCDDRFEVT